MHGLRDFFRREGLGHIVGSPQANRRRRVRNAGIARHENHGHIGLLLPQGFEESNSIHGRHLDVQEDGTVVVLLGQAQTLAGIAALLNLKTLAAENAAAALANHFLVVNNQESRIVQHDCRLFWRMDCSLLTSCQKLCNNRAKEENDAEGRFWWRRRVENVYVAGIHCTQFGVRWLANAFHDA